MLPPKAKVADAPQCPAMAMVTGHKAKPFPCVSAAIGIVLFPLESWLLKVTLHYILTIHCILTKLYKYGMQRVKSRLDSD